MTRAKANGLLLLSAFLWGSGNVAQKTVLEHIGPFTAVGLKCLIAAAVLAPFYLRLPPVAAGRQSRVYALWVILTFALGATFYQLAAGLTSVTNAGFLVNTSTVITPVAAWLLLRQRPDNVVWPAMALAIMGAYLMSGGTLSSINLGDAFALVSAACFSLWMIFIGEFVLRFGQPGFITVMQFLVTGVVGVGVGLVAEPVSLAALGAALPELLLLGVVSTAVGYLLQAIAQSHTSASEAAIIVSGEAVFGALCAFALLGESLSLPGLLGALLIMSGIGLVQLKQSQKPTQVRAEGGHS